MRPPNPGKKQRKWNTFKSLYGLFEVIKTVLNGYENEVFPLQPTEVTGMSARVANVSNR